MSVSPNVDDNYLNLQLQNNNVYLKTISFMFLIQLHKPYYACVYYFSPCEKFVSFTLKQGAVVELLGTRHRSPQNII